MLHHEIAGLSTSPLELTVTTRLHHCNDCGRELHSGDPMLWARDLGVPFCIGCQHTRGLVPTRLTRGWLRRVSPEST